MNLGRTNGHSRRDDQIADVVVEELLTGRYEAGAPDLVAVSQFLSRVRALGDRPAPPPSAALTQILSGSVPAGGEEPSPMGRTPVRATPLGDGRGPADLPLAAARPRPTPIRRRAAAAATIVGVVVVLAAGSAGLLPGPTQQVAGKIVRAMTPFELPEEREPGLVPSTGPSGGSPGPSSDPRPAAPGAAEPPPVDGSTAGRSRPVVGDGVSSGSRPLDGKAAPVPATSPSPPPGPAVPETMPPHPSPNSAPAPPQPQPSVFRVDLSGVAAALPVGDPDGHGTAVLDANPARAELCLTLVVSGLAPTTAAHLHAGSLGVSGPVVATFTGPPAGSSTECIPVRSEVIAEIRQAPEAHYLDVHSLEFPTGALRGQLRR